MRDINFFRQYTTKKERKFDKRIIYFALGNIVILALVAFSLFNLIKIKQETKVINSLRATVEDPQLIKRVEQIEDKQREVDVFRETVSKIKVLDENIMAQDIIGEELLELISLRMPEELILTYLSVSNPTIEMRGVAQDKWIVAEFAKGLEDIENVEDIFVSNITTEDGYYSFALSITLKDVSQNDDESN